MTNSPKKILITFARSYWALDLCRQLSAAGHSICIADSVKYPISRFSNSVCRTFKVPSPRFDPKGYFKALKEVIIKEKIDLLIPVFEEISVISTYKNDFPDHCCIFCPPFELYHELHNKWMFHRKQRSLGIACPQAYLIRSPQDLKKADFKTPFALKPSYSRAQQVVRKVYPKEPVTDIEIEEGNPWIAQEWIDGERFCTYTVCHSGAVHAHSIYPVEYAINGNSCLTFKNIDHPKIFEWIKNFVSKVNYTGQIAFDFIQPPGSGPFAIECNPRATSGLHLFDKNDRLDQAFLGLNSSPIYPQKNARRQLATGMLLYGWKKSAIPNQHFGKFLKDLCRTQDVLLRAKDLKPLLYEPVVLGEILADCMKYKRPIPAAFTYDHDWNGQELGNQFQTDD